jgi:hypothetical protein
VTCSQRNSLWKDGVIDYHFTTKAYGQLGLDRRVVSASDLPEKSISLGLPDTRPRDGRYIYFNSALASEPAFARVRISDGKVEKVADLGNIRPGSSIFGAWSGFAPDDSPLLLRDTGTKEIFALDWQAP